MISHFRNFAKSPVAIVLFVLLMISFAVVGSQMDVFGAFGTKHVISAGDRSVDAAEYRADFERVRSNLQEQAGRPVSIQDMVDENIDARFLESQTQQKGFLAWAWKAGIRPGQALIIKQIRKIPAFFNQVTGQFDQAQYEQALAQQNATPAQLEQEFRDQYATEHFAAGLFAGARAPRIYAALLAGQALETRDGRWFLVTPAMAGAVPNPTDAQLNSFIQENAERLRRPEFRIASVALFTPTAADSAAPISDEKITERFNFRRDALSEPEKRTFVTFSAPSRAVADRIAAALRAGQSPADVGRANSIEPADYTDSPRTVLGDQAVGAGVFALQAGQVSDPIQAGVGFTVAKVTAITPAKPATLEGSRAAIVEELRQEDARQKTYARVEAYERARQGGKSMADAAQEVGARVITLPPFTQDGKLPNGQPLQAPEQIFSTAWGLSKGGESDIVDAGQGQYFAVRVDDIRPAALPTLTEVREPLTQQWKLREEARLLAAKAEELAGRVRSGQDIAAVAASANATLVTRTGIQQSRDSQTALGQGVLQGLFGQGAGQVFSLPNAQSSYVVGRVDRIHAAVPALAAPLVEQARPRITQDIVQAMIQSSIEAGARDVKAKNDPVLARQALGLSDTPAAPGAPAPAAPAR